MNLRDDFSGTRRFTLVSHLGSGGFGAVFHVIDQDSQAHLALKLLRSTDGGALRRFKNEFRSLADVVHRNLVTLYELHSDEKRWFFTMELLAGKTLLDHVHVHAGSDPISRASTERHEVFDPLSTPPATPWAKGLADIAWPVESPPRGTASVDAGVRLDVRELCDCLLQLGDGLLALHAAGKLHRDIKPSNVMVTPEHRVVILDFGLAAEMGQSSSSGARLVVGTPEYMSPEQAQARPLTEASDWYSVGVILYQALTGQSPFPGPSYEVRQRKLTQAPPPPLMIDPGAHPGLSALCSDLLRISPADRPTGPEVRERLEQIRAGFPSSASATASAAQDRSAEASGGDGNLLLPAAISAPRPAVQEMAVGRSRQLRAFHAAYQNVRGASPGVPDSGATGPSRATVVLCHGGSGMGKSTLIQQFLAQLAAREPDTVLLTGRCYEHEEVPFKALDGLIDSLCHFLEGAPPIFAEGVMPRDVQALARLFPVLAHIPAVEAAPHRLIPDDQQRRVLAFAALRELLLRLTDRRKVVMAIDDLQWGDLDSVALLREILQPPEAPPMLLILSYRSEEAASNPVLTTLLAALQRDLAADVREVPLHELDPAQAESLARSLLGADVPAEQVAAIAAEGHGNPYFITELCHEQPAPGPKARAIDEIIRARVQALPRPARLLLEVVALAGQPLPRPLARQAAGGGGEDDIDEPQALALLRAGHLIRSRRQTDREDLEPYHDRIRETVVAHLAPAVARDHHRRLAEALLASGEAEPEQLTSHLQKAGQRAEAARYAALAARQAQTVLAFERAAHLYQRALDLVGDSNQSSPDHRQASPSPNPDGPGGPGGSPGLPDAAALLAGLGDSLSAVGRSREAARAYLQVADQNPAQALRHRRLAADQLLHGGHVDEGMAVLRRVFAQLGLSLPTTRRRALVLLLLLRLRILLRGLRFHEQAESAAAPEQLQRIDACWSAASGLNTVNPIQAHGIQARQLLLSLQVGEPYRLARALSVEGLNAAVAGTRTRARSAKILAQAAALAEHTHNPHAAGIVAINTAFAALVCGEWVQGASLMRRAEALLVERCVGVAWELDALHVGMMFCLLWQGRLREMADWMPALLKDAMERGNQYNQTMLRLTGDAFIELAADQPERARQTVRTGIEPWSKSDFFVQHHCELKSRVNIALYTGQGDFAWSLVEGTWNKVVGSGLLRAQLYRVESLRLRALAILGALGMPSFQGDRDRLLKMASRAAQDLLREKAPWAMAQGTMFLAVIGRYRGEPGAIDLLAQAARDFAAADMALCAAAARRRQGEWIGGERGRALIEEADGWMGREQRIKNPAAMTAMLVPGG